jgi:hypothetical protein
MSHSGPNLSKASKRTAWATETHTRQHDALWITQDPHKHANEKKNMEHKEFSFNLQIKQWREKEGRL